MKSAHVLTAVGLLALIGVGAWVLADGANPATTQPAPEKTFRMSVPEVLKTLPDLTADQKAQIVDLHKKTDAEVDKLRRQEKEDVWALLSDAQKDEVQQADATAAAKRKEAAAAKKKAQDEAKAAAAAATQPAEAK